MNSDGDAELKLGKITLTESAPVAWQTVNGRKLKVKAEWKVLAQDRLAIALGDYDGISFLQMLGISMVAAELDISNECGAFVWPKHQIVLKPEGRLLADFPTQANCNKRCHNCGLPVIRFLG
jgi:hypothetical protein